MTNQIENRINILNIVDNIEQVNFGIWNAALSTSKELLDQGYVSWILHPEMENPPQLPCNTIPVNTFKGLKLLQLLNKNGLKPRNTVVVTHGCWRYPTRLGHFLKKNGFRWMYVPHGMLEPWSMKHKYIKKILYFKLYEKRISQKADIIRAVGRPEKRNLENFYTNVQLIPNGIDYHNETNLKNNETITFLFMGRLHHKKGIVELVKGWKKSDLNNNDLYQLLIAGPDDGALHELYPILKNCGNIKYLGGVYGKNKEDLLHSSHFFVLPSHSEGFPTSVIEAMSYGLVPLISQGCNFPEAFEKNLAIHLFPDIDQITLQLNNCKQMSIENIQKLGNQNKSFILEHYTNQKIANIQQETFYHLITETKNALFKKQQMAHSLS